MSRPWWSVALLVTALAAGAAPSVALACDAAKRARARHDGPRSVRAPLIVGDSTMLLAAPYLGARGIEADARGCRQFSAGIELLRKRRRAGTLPRVAVLALGANGAIGADAIRKALRILGRRRVLGLVTPPRAGSGSARPMFAARRRHPDRVMIINWAAFSAAHGGWFAGDGLHVNYTGARAFARLVRRRLEPFVGPPRKLKVPAGVAGAKACGRVHRFGGARDVFVVRGRSRVSCVRARRLVRSPPLRGIERWRYYAWALDGRKPWTDVYVRDNRHAIVAATDPGS